MNIFNTDLVRPVGLVLGGLALFIYGINQMSDGLKSIAGSRIREYIEKYTSNLFMAVLVGTIITGVLQSSTAVTVISISLVRAGLMRLEQAIGITIGANIGTCFTSIMIGLNIEQFAYYIIFAGIVLMLLAKKKKITYLGRVLLGFGFIFAGLEIMGDQLVQVADQAWFNDAMQVLGKNPWLALLGGTIATAALQSSTAVIGIVQKLYTTGAIAPVAGVAFIFGSNVGTTLTAIIAGAGGSVSSKRAAWFHAVYNIAGALLGMLILTPFVYFTNWVNDALSGNAEMWIAQAHFIFNVGSTLLIFPFVNQSVKLLKLLIPGDDRQGAKIETIDELDYSLITTFPAAALEVAKKNTIRMGRNVLEIVKVSRTYLETKNSEDYDEVQEIESIVNKYDTNLSKYLLKIVQQQTLAKDQTTEYSKNFLIVKNLERMSDLCVNLSEFYKMVYDEKEYFSTDALEELGKIYDLIETMIPEVLDIYENENADTLLAEVNKKEKMINELEDEFRERHFVRMCNEECPKQIAASVFVDILSNLERIGDHSLNIANNTVNLNKNHEDKYLEVAAAS
ncbi:Na/Pi cotransporter family protein [Breznakia pachnodae]|uniref:Phosphate:Na+ symporter n=1 Tax=Breznakia pachnodae TaxID=265178 RepID=A0ABU0DYF0_9FIRM|nr:Na/Pi cotransporter family protein [Breznakia pachnodae]MDQ0359667.1 phosphate:Na+ symporter [Breznakia pachnodae]